MWTLFHYVKETLANALYSLVACAWKSVHLHLPYPPATETKGHVSYFALTRSYLLIKYAWDQAIAENDVAVQRNVQPSNMTMERYDDDLNAKSCKGAGVYNESTLNDVFSEGADASIRHSLRNY